MLVKVFPTSWGTINKNNITMFPKHMGAFNTSIRRLLGGLGPIAVKGLHPFLLDPEVENKSTKKIYINL